MELHVLWLKLNWWGEFVWWYADTIVVTLRQQGRYGCGDTAAVVTLRQW